MGIVPKPELHFKNLIFIKWAVYPAWNRMGNLAKSSMMGSKSCNSNQGILFDMEYFGADYYYIFTQVNNDPFFG